MICSWYGNAFFYQMQRKNTLHTDRLLSMCVEKKIGYAHTCVTLLHMRITDQRSLCVVVVPKSSTPFITNSRERRDPPKYVHTYDVGIRIIGTYKRWDMAIGRSHSRGHKIPQRMGFFFLGHQKQLFK